MSLSDEVNHFINELLEEEELKYINLMRRNGRINFPSTIQDREEIEKYIKKIYNDLMNDLLFKVRLEEL